MKKSVGFTIIELMIVVAVAGILASILLQAHQEYKNKKNGYQSPTAMEKEISLAGQKCDIGIDQVRPSEVADFLNKHDREYTVLPVGQGVLVHRKSCDR